MSQHTLARADASAWSADGVGPQRDQRWAQLTQAICTMGRELSVSGRLQQTVEAAAATTGARFAAIVLHGGATGAGDRVVHSVTDPDELAAAQQALQAHGASWLATLSAPAGEPLEGKAGPVRFLAVRIHTGGGHYGTICVMEPRSPEGFAPDDQNLLASLADTTGVGVDCATAFEESERRGDWLTASTAIGEQLLTLTDGVMGVAQNIVDHILRLSGATTVTIVVPHPDDPDLLEVRVAAGLGAEQLTSRSFPAAGSFAAAAMTTDHGQLRVASELSCLHAEVEPERPLTQVLAVPFRGADRNLGAVVASRRVGQPSFSEADLRMAEDFARQAGLALELAEARVTHEHREVQRERDRIARLLQDNVIQRLFSIGLKLQSVAPTITDAAGRTQVDAALADLGETIRQVRESLTPPRGHQRRDATV